MAISVGIAVFVWMTIASIVQAHSQDKNPTAPWFASFLRGLVWPITIWKFRRDMRI